MVTDGPRLQLRATARIGLWATLASAAIGILLALFQVQEWKVPKPLALTLIALLLAVIAVAVSMTAYEITRAVRKFLEDRAISPAWVSADAPGLLDYEADANRAQNRLTKEMNKQTKETERLSKKLNRAAKRAVRLQGKNAKRRQRHANRSARSIAKNALFVEKRLPLLKALVKDIDRNYRGFISTTTIQSHEQFDELLKLRDVVNHGRAVTNEAMRSVNEYRQSVADAEAQNLSRTIRLASDRLEKGLAGIAKVLRDHERTMGAVVREMDAKLEEG